MVMLPATSFWSGKRVLVTGHTGFKGAWLTIWLHRLGAEVIGVALPPDTAPSLFEGAGVAELCDSHICDIRDLAQLSELVRQSGAEVVLHLAAQPLVRASYVLPVDTFATNVLGTAHVLEAVRGSSSIHTVVAVTTDKVYRNLETIFPYREDDALGGYDPYSASKAAAELVVDSYRNSFLKDRQIRVASARAGNVIGGGDWSSDRLIPDAVRAWKAGKVLEIRRPDAVRPWQHVLEPLSAYLRLAERLSIDPDLAGAYNFGPRSDASASVREVVTHASRSFGSGETAYADKVEGPHEAGLLTLEVAKAKARLGIEPRWDLVRSVERTMLWYKAVEDGRAPRAACLDDIAAFEDLP